MSDPRMADVTRSVYRALPERLRDPVHRFRRRANGRARWLTAMVLHPSLRHLTRRLEALRGTYAGQRCWIMGNGPSLNEMDLSRFAGEHVWASNRAYLLFDRIGWRPDFWVAVDRRVVPDIADELMQLQSELPGTRFFYPDDFLLQGDLRPRPNTYWFREGTFDESDVPWGVFTRNAASWVSPVRTVTITAIQLAVHLGFDPIYLIGCDTTYRVPPTVEQEAGNPEHLLSTRDDDPNHFDPRYFGTGRRWHDPHVDRMLEHYAYVEQAAAELGVTIANATIGGSLEVFPRVDYRSLT